MQLEKLPEGVLEIGKAAPWPLYDENHKLLLARGVVLETQTQIDMLIARGLYRVIRPPQARRPSETSEVAQAQGSSKEESLALDEVKLTIGDTIQLQSQADGGGKSRYYVKLVGYLRNKGLIVSTPTLEGKVLLMREGQSFVVRMFSGQSVYAFPSSIVKVANVPYPHLHLSYPSLVRGLVVRKGARARVNLIAAIQDCAGRSTAGTVTDLSTGGAALDAKTPLGAKGEEISLKFRVIINDVEQYITLRATIRSVHAAEDADGQPGAVQHGLQFIEVPHAEHVALAAFVYQRLFEEAADA